MGDDSKHRVAIGRCPHVAGDVNLGDGRVEMTFDDISTRFETVHGPGAHSIARFGNRADCFRSGTCDHLAPILALDLVKWNSI